MDHEAPDPRRRYASPQGLADDQSLDPAERETLLTEWQYDLEQRLKAISEGMDEAEATNPSEHARLSAELREVSYVHAAITHAGK